MKRPMTNSTTDAGPSAIRGMKLENMKMPTRPAMMPRIPSEVMSA